MTHVQVRCNLLPVNELPEDVVVNTWSIDADGADWGDVTTAFQRFYNVVPPGGATLCVANYLAWTIKRDDGLAIELIEAPEVPPNVPFETSLSGLEPASSTGDPDDPVDPLPQEVAFVLSMFAAGYPAVAQPGRHRGRVYIGPLSYNTNAGVATGQPARPGVEFRTVVLTAGVRLAQELLAANAPLCIWSRADDVFREVFGMSVDDEWDTQRRRGRKRTLRDAGLI